MPWANMLVSAWGRGVNYRGTRPDSAGHRPLANKRSAAMRDTRHRPTVLTEQVQSVAPIKKTEIDPLGVIS